MLLKSEAELIDIQHRILMVLEYLDRQADKLSRNFPDEPFSWAILEGAERERLREDLQYLMNLARYGTALFLIVDERRAGGL